jgi:hypothetical protein
MPRPHRRPFRLRVAGAAALTLALVATAAAAADRAPLLVEGKQTVFQRALARNGATLHAEPGGPATGSIPPLQPLYVYGRRDGWVEVGRGLSTGPEGWTAEGATVDWRQNIIVSLANPAGRERQLLFETEAGLMEVVRHESPIGMARELRRKVLETGAAEGVASIEPADYVDIQQNFYLLPILDWREEEHPMTFEIMRVLKLASMPLRDEPPVETPAPPRTAGVVFVIDTTRSMQPYIEATQAAVRAIMNRIQADPRGQNVRFAAIGFRDSPEAARVTDPTRDIEYRTRTFLDLAPGQTPEAIVAAFEQIEEARASTVGYAEDALSGVWQAINMPGWLNAGHDGGAIEQRYVFVISDASPKSPGDASLPAEIRDLDASAMALQAQAKGIIIGAIHLKTPDGVANHRAAEAAYVQLTSAPGGGEPAYAAVDLTRGQDPAGAFRPVIDIFASVVLAETDRPTEEMAAAAAEGALSPLEQRSLAMRLEWIGRRRDVAAQDLLEVWAIDRSLENPLVPALDRRLLISKNELSTMADVLREISQIGEQTQGEMREGEFFELLRGALARMAQNPSALVDAEFATLDEAVSEHLADLPYQSPILGDITPERWLNMGAERRTTLDRVKSRLQLLEHFHDDETLWTALYEGAPDGERVFAMPFEALP